MNTVYIKEQSFKTRLKASSEQFILQYITMLLKDINRPLSKLDLLQ